MTLEYYILCRYFGLPLRRALPIRHVVCLSVYCNARIVAKRYVGQGRWSVAVLARNIWGHEPPPDGERGNASL